MNAVTKSARLPREIGRPSFLPPDGEESLCELREEGVVDLGWEGGLPPAYGSAGFVGGGVYYEGDAKGGSVDGVDR